ncbi:MAG: hypothetical protein JJT77_02955 [Crocinitomicaceae bacterium]|nr:hypothetical protein [Crocinitomicaceae bacterium]
MATRIFLFFFGLALFVQECNSQDLYNLEFHISSQKQQKHAMLTLGGWAGTNIVTGTFGFYTQKDESRYFHQMNVGWNIVNLGLAATGLLQLQKTDDLPKNAYELIQNQNKLERIFLLNGALNFTYISAGVALRNYSYRDLDNYHRWKGYGNALILQGGFLAIFDFTNYFMHKNRSNKFLSPLLRNIEIQSNGIELGLTYYFN